MDFYQGFLVVVIASVIVYYAITLGMAWKLLTFVFRGIRNK